MSDPNATVDAVTTLKRAQWAIFCPGDRVRFSSNTSVADLYVDVVAVDSRSGYPVMITDIDGVQHFSDSTEIVALLRRPLTGEAIELDLPARFSFAVLYGGVGEQRVFELRDDEPSTVRAVYDWDGPDLRVEITRWYNGDGTAYDIGRWRHTMDGLEFTAGDVAALGDDETAFRTVADFIWDAE